MTRFMSIVESTPDEAPASASASSSPLASDTLQTEENENVNESIVYRVEKAKRILCIVGSIVFLFFVDIAFGVSEAIMDELGISWSNESESDPYLDVQPRTFQSCDQFFDRTICGYNKTDELDSKKSLQSMFLKALYNESIRNGEDWRSSSGWNCECDDIDVCEWPGVTCSDSNINGINLHDNNVYGNTTLFGEGLKVLDSIKKIDLSNNYISGPISSLFDITFSSLSRFDTIDVNGNERIYGTVYGWQCHLRSLKIKVGCNIECYCCDDTHCGFPSFPPYPLRGPSARPPEHPSPTHNLQRYALTSVFTELNGYEWPQRLHWLDYTKSICEWERVSCTNDDEVDVLELGANMLGGSIPSEIGLMQYLKVLNANNNFLSDELPTELGLLTSLETLHLQNNSLEGHVPSELGNLESLLSMNLQTNEITGIFPIEICQNVPLQSLVVDTDKVQCSCCEG